MNELTKKRILEILGKVNRQGMENVLTQMEQMGYFRAECYGHHRYSGGMADHALEVYDHMMKANHGRFSEDSIAIVALFHDFGKAVRRNREYGYAEHPKRSLAILDKLGLDLNDRERDAIGNHHNYKSTRGIFGYMANPLRLSLSLGDCKSTGDWKKAHAG